MSTRPGRVDGNRGAEPQGVPADVPEFELLQHEVRGRLHSFDVDRRDFLKVFGGGLLVLSVLPAGRAGVGPRARRAGAAEGRRRLAAHRRGRPRHRLHGQGRDGPEHPHVPRAARRRGAARPGRVDRDRHGRHEPDAVGRRHVRQPHDADDGAAASRRGRRGPRAARRPRGRALEGGPRRRSWPAEARSRIPPRKEALSYGELAKGQKLTRTVAAETAFTPARDWKVAGTAVPKVDGRDFVTGRHRYTSDLARPGMLHGKVLRPAGFKATLVAADLERREAAARRRRRARRRLRGRGRARRRHGRARDRRDRGAVENRAAAVREGAVGRPEEASPNRGSARSRRRAGSVATALAAADFRLESRYTVAFIAHAPLEPRAALAEWNGRRAHGLDGHAAAVRRARRAGRGVSPPRGEGARPRARHGLGVRRQAHGRRRGRGRAPGEGRGQAGEGRLDARGGVHLGLLPPRRRHRGDERRGARRQARGVGVPQLQLGAGRDRDALRRPEHRRSSSTRRARRSGRARIAGSPPRRTTSPARRTWTSWRTRSAWTRSRSG